MILPKKAKILDHASAKDLYLTQTRNFDNWVNSKDNAYLAANKDKIRRAREVLFGDYEINGASYSPPASGRLATIFGYDAIRLDRAYDKTYVLLLNRSILTVDENIIQLGGGNI
jgi:hypothetical protein